MKKHTLMIGMFSLGMLVSNAQSVADGLLFGQQENAGTARFRAMSGAFGALGGDLSAMGINPAGSVVFNNHFASISLTNYNRQNNNTFNENQLSSKDNDLGVNQVGGVMIFSNQNKKKTITKFSLGLNYDTTRSYDDRLAYNGSSSNSIADYFLGFANGIAVDNFQLRGDESISGLYRFLGEDFGFGAQQGFLGYQSFLIDSTDNADPLNTNYVANTGTGSFTQNYDIINAGFNGKVSFNGAIEIKEKLSLGLNLNSHSINYQTTTRFREGNTNADAIVSNAQFINNLDVQGNGFSFQLGAIAKVTDELRLGATYESPTWYTINETNTQEIAATHLENGNSVTEIISPDVVNIFAPYNLRSPGSVTGSIAYIFGEKGLLSVDYSIRNYSNLRFSPANDPVFIDNNAAINNNLTSAATLRIGGEYRIERLSIRAGYRNEASPYENKNIQSDVNGYSFGLGYTWGSTIVDLSYDGSDRDMNQQLFTGVGRTAVTMNNVTLTLGFNL
jgi:(2Fe-2S) ferredoxin